MLSDLLVGVLLCFIFPCDCKYPIQVGSDIVYSGDVPYFVGIFGVAIYDISAGAVVGGSAYIVVWLILALSAVALLVVAMFRPNAWLPAVSLLLCWLAAWYASFYAYNAAVILDVSPELFEFNATPNGIVALILFALYILYLLLRRFYAPAKARVVASVERRKASRKPSKDERIAELEKRVAELESKDEHQKSTSS